MRIQDSLADMIVDAAGTLNHWYAGTSEDKLDWTPGEVGVSKARTINDFMHEVIWVNGRFATVLAGGKPEGDQPPFESIEATKAALTASAVALAEIVRGLSDEQLTENHEMRRGPMTSIAIAQLSALHMWYHGGQINSYQLMYGQE
jgi:uncharacterized damage-inducible protein DinB